VFKSKGWVLVKME